MRVRVRLFARLREIAGSDELPLDVPEGATVEDVWERLAAAHPSLAAHRRSVSAALNAEFARMHTRVGAGDEVAFLPPVSGG
ncbi:MAG: molybdopterin converting factor subunit 1 [Acidobacteria bacterium]|nr:MAG: molybdopterin converting factor subunit 1 [Acidobacteriota bacterium]RPJ74340.1 MAG: molybdopterin converting factor subunit 1 [Acidobacteriota bacterium]